MGGTWDATNVADAQVAVVTPIAIDHTHFLGSTIDRDRRREGGDPQARARTACWPSSRSRPPRCCCAARSRSTRIVAREGLEFGVMARTLAVGGQLLSLRGLAGEYDDVFLPLLGAHQAHNAACALAAVEAFLGGAHAERGPLDVDLVRAAFAGVTSPGRLEIGPQLADRGARRRAQPGRRPRRPPRRWGSPSGSPGWSACSPRWPTRTSAACSRRSSRCSPRSWSPSRPPAGRCRPTSWRRSPSRCSAPTGSRWPRGWTTPSTRPSRWPRRRAHLGGAGVLVTGSIVTVARGPHPAGRELTVRVPAS